MKPGIKNSVYFLLTVFLAINFFANSILQAKEKRETIFDRKVHLEKEIFWEIPQVPPWCDKLDLRKRWINVGDCKLYVEEEGKGIPIVLLHGGPGGTHNSFHPHFSRAKDFARIIYYDQRGCGLSDYQKGNGYTVDQAVDDLENLRRAVRIERWVILGWSYGGYLGQRYIIKYPKSVSGLILVTSEPGLFGNLESTRQYDFISKEEKRRINEVTAKIYLLSQQKKLSRESIIELIVFNRHLNGSWKRQHFYRPPKEELARAALYGWKHDKDFNKIINQDMENLDLEGAFKGSPIPTLIIESKWDLTWNTDKPKKLAGNHPGAELVMFEHSGHSPFADEPGKFFQVLRNFIQNLRQIYPTKLSSWQEYLSKWKKKSNSNVLKKDLYPF